MSAWLPTVAEIDAVWPMITEGLGKSLQRSGGDMSLGSLYQQCGSGAARALIWIEGGAAKGACVVRPEVWEAGPRLRVLAMYGDAFAEWQGEGWAALHGLKLAFGAEAIIFEGRLGWARKAPGAKVIRALYEVS